ncbi:MAG: sensor histidine kinase [Steroidobacteraceae bacterium]
MNEPGDTREPCRPPTEPRAARINLVWLCYSVFFFVMPVEVGTLRAWLTTLLLYGCFLALYLNVAIAGHPQRTRQVLVAALVLLGFGAYRLNPGAGVVFIYIAAFAPAVTDSLAVGIAIIGAAALAAALEGWALGYSPWTWAIFAFFAVPAGISSLYWTLRTRANARLNLAHEQIEHLAQLAERERIARDMHDVLGHTLSLIVLKSELAGKLLPSEPARAQREIQEVEQTARRALAEVRQTIRGYRTEGLAAELSRAEQTLALAGVRLECTAELPRLGPLIESTLSLVLRESVTNIVRHAQAARCRLTIAEEPSHTLFEITDDGRGGIEHEGSGLRGMRERLEALGGELAIDSREGTRLRVQIPSRSGLPEASHT